MFMIVWAPTTYDYRLAAKLLEHPVADFVELHC
jgi:hypothetical protein